MCLPFVLCDSFKTGGKFLLGLYLLCDGKLFSVLVPSWTWCFCHGLPSRNLNLTSSFKMDLRILLNQEAFRCWTWEMGIAYGHFQIEVLIHPCFGLIIKGTLWHISSSIDENVQLQHFITSSCCNFLFQKCPFARVVAEMVGFYFIVIGSSLAHVD